MNTANSVLYAAGIATSRLGTLFFYLRVFPQKGMQHATITFMFLSTGLVISFLLWDIFSCRPVSLNWNLGVHGECKDRVPSYQAACILSISSDIVTLLLPMPLVWGLKMRRENKIGLTCLFAMGLRYLLYVRSSSYSGTYRLTHTSVTIIASWRLVVINR